MNSPSPILPAEQGGRVSWLPAQRLRAHADDERQNPKSGRANLTKRASHQGSNAGLGRTMGV